MKVTLDKLYATVTREKGDAPVRGGTWGTSESAFWFRVRNALKASGLDVIKKEMTKDGHLVADGIYYVRTRDGKFGLWDDRYAVRSVASDYNETGEVTVKLEGARP